MATAPSQGRRLAPSPHGTRPLLWPRTGRRSPALPPVSSILPPAHTCLQLHLQTHLCTRARGSHRIRPWRGPCLGRSPPRPAAGQGESALHSQNPDGPRGGRGAALEPQGQRGHHSPGYPGAQTSDRHPISELSQPGKGMGQLPAQLALFSGLQGLPAGDMAPLPSA